MVEDVAEAERGQQAGGAGGHRRCRRHAVREVVRLLILGIVEVWLLLQMHRAEHALWLLYHVGIISLPCWGGISLALFLLILLVMVVLVDDPLYRQARIVFIQIEVVQALLCHECRYDIGKLDQSEALSCLNSHIMDLSEDLENLNPKEYVLELMIAIENSA